MNLSIKQCIGCLNRIRLCPAMFQQSLRIPQRSYARWEPDDIQYTPEIPEYDQVNIQMKGYDYVRLESFLKYVHKLTSSLGIDTNVYPSPARTSNVHTFKPFSTTVQNEYKLAVYERTVQVCDLPNTLLPTFMEAVQQNTPEGVSVCVKVADPDEEEFRFVPDLMLLELKSQVDELDKAKDERKRK